MNDKKWAVTDKPTQKPQIFPWGTLGALIIIAFSGVMIAVIVFFVYSGKYERSLVKLNRQISETKHVQIQLEKAQEMNNELELKLTEVEAELLERESDLEVANKTIESMVENTVESENSN